MRFFFNQSLSSLVSVPDSAQIQRRTKFVILALRELEEIRKGIVNVRKRNVQTVRIFMSFI